MNYLIRGTQHFFHGDRTHYFGLYGIDKTAPIVPFDSHAAARAVIDEFEGEPYMHTSGECSRPTLMAVRVSQAPAVVRDRMGLPA